MHRVLCLCVVVAEQLFPDLSSNYNFAAIYSFRNISVSLGGPVEGYAWGAGLLSSNLGGNTFLVGQGHEGAWGGDAHWSVLRAIEPKKSGARSALARTRGPNPPVD
jgi:hypothetical protein